MNDYEKNFNEARATISDIDKEIAVLFEKRMNAAKAVAEYKKVNGLPIEDLAREESLIKSNSELVKDEEIRSYYINYLKNTMN
ncbi:MAG: chorismate mutase, partial [Oscillospiraceae bacterium]|nr:chorismate mutase [Oscillospiraceae bacterium]